MTDEDLLAPLREEPAGYPTIDVPRAMAEGRRRRRRKQWTGAAAVAAAVLLVAGGGALAVSARHREPMPATPPPLPADCRVTALPADGEMTLVTAGDSTGRYLVGEQFPRTGGDIQNIIWKDGAVLARASIATALLTAVNSRGEAVGNGHDTKDVNYGYVYRDGTFTRLAGGRSQAAGVSDAGVIVGTVGGGPRAAGRPARWSSATAQPEQLPLPAGSTGGEARGIGADGTIFGTVGAGPGTLTGYLWLPDGTGRPLALPLRSGEQGRAFLPDAVAGGWVYGSDSSTSSAGWPASAAARYSVAGRRFEPTIPATGTYFRYSANGLILSDITDPQTKLSRPTVFAGTRSVRLPLYGAGPGRYMVASFSANGRVAAGSVEPYQGTKVEPDVPLLWTCR